MLPKDIRNLNKMLATNHGESFNHKPWFRISWTDDELEKRVGLFNDFYGDIFIRQFHGMREVRKYEGPQYKERWVLEKLIFVDNPEVWDLMNTGSYEPIWVFRSPGGGYQKPIYKSVDFVIGMLNSPKKYMNDKMLDSDEDIKLEAEVASIKDMFDQNASMFDEEATIVVPHNFIGGKGVKKACQP